MRPVVGVLPLWDDKKNSIWMQPAYWNGVHQFGGLSIILPLLTDREELRQLADMCDGFLFTGGPDVLPEWYHEEPMEDLITVCEMRDVMERILLEMAIEDDKPVLGICRGIQLINVVLGGTLYQDLPAQHPSEAVHYQSVPYDVPAHSVTLTAGSPLHQCLGVDELQVNSCHHQAVKDLSPELAVMAVSEDEIIEAAYRPDSRFLWAVQWHPERTFQKDASSRKIFKAFMDSIKTSRYRE